MGSADTPFSSTATTDWIVDQACRGGGPVFRCWRDRSHRGYARPGEDGSRANRFEKDGLDDERGLQRLLKSEEADVDAERFARRGSTP